MMRFLRYHGLQSAAAAAMAFAAWGVYQKYIFVENFGVVVAGRLYRSSQPTARAWHILRRHKIGRLVNLRTETEAPAMFALELAVCDSGDMSMTHIPVAARLPGERQILQFLRVVRSSEEPVLVHCKHGEDRTGLMVAAYRIVVDDWPVPRALAEMRRFRARLKGEQLRNAQALLSGLKRHRQSLLKRTEPHPAP